MNEAFSHLGMPKQKLGPKHSAPLRFDLIKKSLSLTSGIGKDFRMAHLFVLSVLVFSGFLQEEFSGIKEWKRTPDSTMLSLNDPSLSTVQFLYRNNHLHLLRIRVTSSPVSQICRFVSISVNASQSKAMLSTSSSFFKCCSMELLLGSCLTSSIKGRITTEKGSVVLLLFLSKLPFWGYSQ